MQWVLDNKQWLFSGVGVCILGGLLTMLVRFLRGRAARPSGGSSIVERSAMVASPVATGSNITQNVINIVPRQDAQQSAAQRAGQTLDEYSPRPTPREIYAQLATIPTFQQREAAKAYVGIKVRWRGTFHSIEEARSYMKRNDGATHLVLLADGTGSLIMVPVDIERVPRLKVTHAKTPMEVRGTIREVGPSVELDGATLLFVDAD